MPGHRGHLSFVALRDRGDAAVPHSPSPPAPLPRSTGERGDRMEYFLKSQPGINAGPVIACRRGTAVVFKANLPIYRSVENVTHNCDAHTGAGDVSDAIDLREAYYTAIAQSGQ